MKNVSSAEGVKSIDRASVWPLLLFVSERRSLGGALRQTECAYSHVADDTGRQHGGVVVAREDDSVEDVSERDPVQRTERPDDADRYHDIQQVRHAVDWLTETHTQLTYWRTSNSARFTSSHYYYNC